MYQKTPTVSATATVSFRSLSKLAISCTIGLRDGGGNSVDDIALAWGRMWKKGRNGDVLGSFCLMVNSNGLSK